MVKTQMVHLFCYYYFNGDAVGYFTHLVHTKSIDIGHCTSIIEFLEDGFSTNFADPDIGGSIFIEGTCFPFNLWHLPTAAIGEWKKKR